MLIPRREKSQDFVRSYVMSVCTVMRLAQSDKTHCNCEVLSFCSALASMELSVIIVAPNRVILSTYYCRVFRIC
jgi:hypothetical protein